MHGRKPVFATPRALAASYLDEYVDLTGRITAFALVDLRVMGAYDWRLSGKNVWKVERMLLDTRHQPLGMPDTRFREFRRRYREFKERHPNRKPLFYEGRHTWTPIPNTSCVGALGARVPRGSDVECGAKAGQSMMVPWLRKIRLDFNPSARCSVPAAAPRSSSI